MIRRLRRAYGTIYRLDLMAGANAHIPQAENSRKALSQATAAAGGGGRGGSGSGNLFLLSPPSLSILPLVRVPASR
jgi:hypothetical protein